jgi:hypothetical protein
MAVVATSGSALLVIGIVVAVVLATAAFVVPIVFAWRRAWPSVRAQEERLREKGGPRGEDFDSVAARYIEKLPLYRRPSDAERSERCVRERDAPDE